MTDPLFWHRLQFGFTITYHYLFPQLTMGLALLLVILKTVALRTGKSSCNDAARRRICSGRIAPRAGPLDRLRP